MCTFSIFCFFHSFEIRFIFSFHSFPSFYMCFEIQIEIFPLTNIFFLCRREREKKSEKGKWTFALHKKQSTTIYDASKNQINIKMVSFNDETSGKHEYEVFCTIAKEKNNMKMTKRMKRKKTNMNRLSKCDGRTKHGGQKILRRK